MAREGVYNFKRTTTLTCGDRVSGGPKEKKERKRERE